MMFCTMGCRARGVILNSETCRMSSGNNLSLYEDGYISPCFLQILF